MTERITHRDTQEGQYARDWHSRFDDPFAQQEMTEQPITATENPSMQIDYNNARMIDQARYDDPRSFLEAQLNMLPEDARTEIQATIPTHSFYEGEIVK